MKLTIATITARIEPRYDWLTHALLDQAQEGDEIELVIVDYYGRVAGELVPAEVARASRRGEGLLRVVVVPPKPTPFQGSWRVTRRELHAIASARNTALVLASHDYIAFVDDRVRLGPRWLETVRTAEATREAAICGPCDRDILGLGRIFDDRKERAPNGRRNCGGDWFYGGCFALPLAWALEVNGCEEATDPVGRQDRVMGHMLTNRGRQIDYLPAMSVLLDRKLRETHPFPRVGKGVPPGDKGRAIMKRFATRTRTEATPDLLALREAVQRGESFPSHGRTAADPDWFDGKPIGEM